MGIEIQLPRSGARAALSARGTAAVCAVAGLLFAAPAAPRAAAPTTPPARPSGPGDGASAESSARSELEPIVAAGRLAELHWPDFSDYRLHVLGFYESRAWVPAWTRKGRATEQARAIATHLAAADDKGLNAIDYDGPAWAGRISSLEAAGVPSTGAVARFDAELTVSVMRYLSDLHSGRINPRNIGIERDVEHVKDDLPVMLGSLVASDDVGSTLDAVEPWYDYYHILLKALCDYRALAARFAGWKPLDAPSSPVKPGMAWVEMPRLAQLLAALGDLQGPDAGSASGSEYGPAMVAAVKHFQARHGLGTDGVLGGQTLAELNTPFTARLEQLKLTLERMRWVPRDIVEPPIVVNVPAFRLRAFERRGDKFATALTMNVIVGKEYSGTQTPLFARKMSYLVFSPYWEVPPSIARRELLPRMTPDYAAANDYVIEGPSGPLPINSESIALVRSGSARIRQKPGPKNALGAVKFIFPNEHNVYLHSTPATSLFDRSERALSHGCIRLADPVGLAEFVLRTNSPPWDRAMIESAMAKGEPTTVHLTKPVLVAIVYGTAFVDDQGQVRFLRDVYGHDRELAAALAKGYPYPA